jgi:glycosyltransferase involved in cell wall biosynthesis
MKLLLSLHDLALGGTTINAIDLAVALRDRHGYDVTLFASPGPLAGLVHQAGLRYVPAPVITAHPSPARMKALRAIVRAQKPDLVNAWETWACVDAYCALHLPWGVPLLITDMQMQLTRILPKVPAITFGTPQLVDEARARGWNHAELLLPPVDTRLNAPDAADGRSLRERWGVERGQIVLVTVSRLAHTLKGESLLRSIDAIRTLGRELPLKLVIVGDGSARNDVQGRADAVNAQLGRDAVLLPGAMLDPRSAYAAADIVIGMGGSALRAMAFGKPTIIVGEQAFARLFDAQSADAFHYTGMYGIGRGPADDGALVGEIRRTIDNATHLGAVGAMSRDFVCRKYRLDVVAAHFSQLCAAAARRRTHRLATSVDVVRTAAVYLRERRFLWRARVSAPLQPAKPA